MGSEKNGNITDNKLSQVYGKIVLSLDNCLLPQEKLLRSPSIADGLDPETECDLRIIGCELIQTAGILLKLPQVAMATGQVLFQRFYFCKSFVRHPMDVTAMGCVCLASKIEEAPRRIRDVINVFHHIRQVRCQKTDEVHPVSLDYIRICRYYTFSYMPITSLILDQQYIALKTQVIKAERRILKELGFCVHVKHPHKLIVCYLQVLTLEKNRSVMQMAWNYMNDSLRTEVFLQYSPETVACACIYLACRKLKVALPKNPAPWFTLFGVEELDIQDISRRIIKLYYRPKINPDALEGKVEELRKSYEEEREKIRNTNAIVSGNNTPNSNTSHQKSPSPPPAKSRKIAEPSPRKISDSSPRKNRERERDRDRERERDRDSRSKKDRDSRSRRDHDSRSRKDRDSRSRKLRDYKLVNSDSEEECTRSRSTNEIN